MNHTLLNFSPNIFAIRLVRTGIFLVWIGLAVASCSAQSPSSSLLPLNASNLIQQENAHEGARDWQLTRVKVVADGCRSTNIEGYCSKQSVAAGESIDIMVSTNPARDFRVEIFRTGYYGGRGARLMQTIDRVEGITQPEPVIGEKDLHECHWKTSVTLPIPDEWLSGVYLGRLTTIPEGNEPYWQSYVIFIVRDDRPVDVLFQCSDNTWQAYNVWPSHYSVYTHPKGGQGPWADVSFDRPWSGGTVQVDRK